MVLFMCYQILTIFSVVKDMITECHDFNNRSVSEPILSSFLLCRRKPSQGAFRSSDATENPFGLLWFGLINFNLD